VKKMSDSAVWMGNSIRDRTNSSAYVGGYDKNSNLLVMDDDFGVLSTCVILLLLVVLLLLLLLLLIVVSIC
jgi:hypothetical protein